MKSFNDYLKQAAEVGYVESVVTPLFYVSGLPTIRPQEIVLTENGTRGIVQIVLPDLAEVLMLENKGMYHQERVARTSETLSIEISDNLMGRVVDPMGIAIDGKGAVGGKKVVLPIDRPAPGIIERVKVTEPLETGVAIVDLMIQIGKGQKELVAGDQKTGKSTFMLQTLASQAKLGAVCIYVCVGKRKSDLKYILEHLESTGAMKATIVIASTSSDPAALIYYAPFSAFTIGEYYRDKGQDVVIAIDDMSTHAKYYREIALVARKTPGRGSYPGDIFHQQARLLERTGRVKTASGKIASITCLPAAETQEGDLTGYIQTNLMAMTDGHIFFDVNELKSGRSPAINPTLSVTRVGNQTQSQIQKELRAWLSFHLNEYYRIRESMSFGVEVPIEYQELMFLGQQIEIFFNQDSKLTMSKNLQIILFGLLYIDFLKGKTLEQTKEIKDALVKAYIKGLLKTLSFEIEKVTSLKTLSFVLTKYKEGLSNLNGNIQQKTA